MVSIFNRSIFSSQPTGPTVAPTSADGAHPPAGSAPATTGGGSAAMAAAHGGQGIGARLRKQVLHRSARAPAPDAPAASGPAAAAAAAQAAQDAAPALAAAQARADSLDAVLTGLKDWDDAHPVAPEKILAALALVRSGHQHKLGLGERNGAYGKACDLMREGLGIDAETYARAKHTFGMQGLADVYDSAFTTLVLGPALAAVAGPGAAEAGAATAKVVKYAAQWALAPLSNAAGQIIVDAYQDTIVKLEGVPVPGADIANSPKFNKLRSQVKQVLDLAQAQMAIHADTSLPAAQRNAALDSLQACAVELDALHLAYAQRVALGQSNFVKYETQIAYKAVTTPGVIAATVFGGPFAGWGAATVQQAGQAPFGYLDEILLKDHIMRFNTKYADVLTQSAIDAGKTRDSADLTVDDIDLAKAKKLWTRPLQVVTGNVRQVYTDELATRLRYQTKLDRNAAAPGLSPKARGKAEAERDQGREKLASLKQDIVNFHQENWSALDQGGTIAGMLLDTKTHFAALSKAKFRRPGEYTAQVLDRHGGQALPRAILGIASDGAHISGQHWEGHDAAITDSSMTQAGVLLGNAYANPVTKFTKQRVMRNFLLHESVPVPPAPTDGTAAEPVMRRSFRTPRPATPGHLQPVVKLGPADDPVLEVDLRQTRAWMNHTNSTAKIMAQGTSDAVVGLGTHLKAAFTLPVRSFNGARADRDAKRGRAMIGRLERVADAAPASQPVADRPPVLQLSPAAASADGVELSSLLFERDDAGVIRWPAPAPADDARNG